MSENTKIFDKLRQKGHRITPQREEILKFFQNMPEGDHLSAEELQALLRKNGIKISLATLYRTLKFLATNGLLREIDFAEVHKHYELASEDKPHHHMICNKCGLTIEFNDEKVFKHVKEAVKAHDNFQVSDYQLKIFGLCKNCQE